MQFGSDNQTGCSAQVMQAILEANAGHSHGYGRDDWTARAVAALREVFETDLDAYFVTTGTTANGLALASMVQPCNWCCAMRSRTSSPMNPRRRSSFPLALEPWALRMTTRN